jgi:hypothetical protein
MPVINITQADIMKTKNVNPGWYGAKVIKVYSLEPSKAKDSINQKIDIELENSDGKVITKTYNSKLIGMIAPLIEAAMEKSVDPGSFDTDLLLNKKVDVKVVPVVQDGIVYDNIDAILPYGKGRSGQPAF